MRKLKKSLSVFLAAIMLFTTLSVAMPVFAAEKTVEGNNISENIASQKEQEPIIIGEINELRTENIKHFKLSDGSYQVAVYASPVHYKENGEWKEFDNSIKEISSASNGEKKYYAVVADTEFFFPDNLSDGRIKVKKNNHEVSFGYNKDGISVFASSEIINSSDAVTKNSDNFSEKYAIKSGALKYNNISISTDIEYELNSTMLKESIIVSERQSEYTYNFTLSTGTLTPIMSDDGSVLLIDENNDDKLEFVIAAPFMTDAKGIFSNNVSMSLTESENEYILTVTADKEWLNSSGREFPVIIDPTLLYKPDRINDIFDTYVDSATPTTNHYLSTYSIIGYNSLGTGRAYIKFNLPTLPHCGVITHATLGLIQMGYDPGNGVTNHMVVYESPTAQDYQTLTWNNQPSLSEQTIIDFTEFKSGDDGSIYYTLDITKIAKNWFETGTNNGLFLASANESSSWRSTIYTSNYTAYDAYPMISISYIDNKGIEDYWAYETVDMGRSGTAYINEYNGLLTYVHNDINLGGNITYLSASHIYSNNYENAAPYGYGFRLSAQESITIITEEDSSYLYNEGYRAYLTDADGTAHYFKYVSSTTMKYEFDDNLILKVITGQEYSYELQYEDGSKRRYDSSGRLLLIIDRNGNTITHTYDSSGRISKITDAIGRSVAYTYNSSSYLSSMTDAAGRNTTYSYSNGYLQTITYPDSKTTVLTYLSGKLFNIKQADSTNVSFLYQSSGRVNFISLKGTDSTVLKNVNLYYKGSNTLITDTTGKNMTVGFDNIGRAISCTDKDGNIATTEYNTGGNINNTVAESSNVFSFADNKVLNHSFESNFSNWSIWKPSGTNANSISSSQAYSGLKSLKLTCSAEGRIVALQDVTDFVIGKEYTFSAYVKATAMSSGSAFIRIEGKNPSLTVSRINSSSVSAVSDGWVRIQVSYTVPEEVTFIRLCLELAGSSGTVYFDALQFEEASSAGHYNLLINPGFERYSSGTFTGWTATGTVASVSEVVNTSAGVSISGKPSSDSRLVQSIAIGTSSTERTLIFGGAAKGNCAASSNIDNSTSKFGFLLELYSGTTLVASKYALYNAYAIDTSQFLSDSLTADATVDTAKLYLLYDKNVNSAYFDNIFLYIDNFGTTYTYDDDGKLTMQKNNAGDAVSYTYSGIDISKISVTKDGEEKESYTYTYDNKHNILTETTKDGIITSYKYPTSGNKGMPTSVVVKNSSDTLQSSNTYTYSNSYNYLLTVTDARGKTVTTIYNPTRDLLTSTIDENGVVHSYSYNAYNDNLLEVYTDNTDGYFDVSYGYNTNGYLSSVSQNGVSYNFTYDTFGRRTATKVGSQNLATYSYNSKNLLGSTTYGNGTVHSLTYDDSDRVISEAYDGTTSYSYSYNTEGYLGKAIDHELGITTYYGYDLVGRVTDVDSTDGVSSDFSYNEYNSIEAYNVNKDNVFVSGAEYSYNTNGLPETVYLTDFEEPVFYYNYDALNRTTSYYHYLSGLPIQVKYSYLAGTDSNTTGFVSDITYLDSGSTLIPKLSYTYDAKGNILTVSKNDSLNITYTYDSLDRLVREDNKDLDASIAYTYDARGNILSKKYYDYTTGTLGTLNDEIVYAYDNTWKDKLVAYDNLEFEYDSIGNPTVYGYFNLTWQKGRQLASMEFGDVTVLSFEYNAEGLRTEKYNHLTDVTTTYTWSSGLLMQQTDGTNTLNFSYSPDGRPLGVLFNGESYYYLYNLQGDVIGLYNYLGSVVVEYTYDSWGYLIETSGSLASTLGKLNPFRYRGYIYDEETGFYWLRSRYYDPETGRFLNADVFVSTGQGINALNMFAYCNNNPVRFCDNTGYRFMDSLSVQSETAEQRKLSCKLMTYYSIAPNAISANSSYSNPYDIQNVSNLSMDDITNYINDFISALDESFYVSFGLGFGYGGKLSLGSAEIEALIYMNPTNIKVKADGIQYYSSFYIGLNASEMGGVIGWEYHLIYDWDTKEFLDISEDFVRFSDLGFGFAAYKHVGINFYAGI